MRYTSGEILGSYARLMELMTPLPFAHPVPKSRQRRYSANRLALRLASSV
jgi:hypothetical protein